MPLDRLRGIACVVALAVVAGLTGCGKNSPNSSARGTESKAPVVQGTDVGFPVHRKQLNHSGQLQTDVSPWLEAALKDPDPRVRLHAIETWAKNPGNTLDPVTHGLVDPDESVRARAQELFEEALAR